MPNNITLSIKPMNNLPWLSESREQRRKKMLGRLTHAESAGPAIMEIGKQVWGRMGWDD